MPFTATVDVTNTAGVDPTLAAALKAATEAAAAQWAAVLAGSVNLRISVEIVNIPSDRADGRPGTARTIATVADWIFQEGAAAGDLRADANLNGAAYDMIMRVSPSYVVNTLWFDPTPQTSNDIPAGKVDAISTMTHEIGHALGFYSYLGAGDPVWADERRSAYDYRVYDSGGHAVFSGPNTLALLGQVVPLTDHNYSHYGNTVAPPSAGLLNGVMNGTGFYAGTRYAISDLDLAMLADMGLGTIRNDIFDQYWMPILRGGAGVDLYRGDYSGQSAAMAVNGGHAAAVLPGLQLFEIERLDLILGSGDDTFLGGNFADKVAGGGGGDRLIAGQGADTFVIGSLGDIAGGGDTIVELESGVDRIDLTAIANLSFIGSTAFTNVAGQLNFTVSGAFTLLRLDANGDGAADGTIRLAGGAYTLAETAPGSHVLMASALTVVDDYGSTTATLGAVAVGGQAFGINDTNGDVDWFKAALIAGHTYQLDLMGLSGGQGTMVDPRLEVMNAAGGFLIGYSDGGAGSDSRGQFAPLTSGDYYLAVSSEAFVIALVGVGGAGSYRLSLSDLTPDTTAPLLISTAPADDATGVATNTNFVLTFSEAVQAGAGGAVEIRRADNGALVASIALSDAAQASFAGPQLTIDPSILLATNASYYLTLAAGAVRDLAGNAFAGIAGATAFSFSTVTVDAVAPTLTGSTPADDAVGVAVDANLILTFSEAIALGAGAIEIRRSADASLLRSIAVGDASQVSLAGATLTINPAVDLATASGYYILLAAGVVSDLAGNPFAGLSSATALNFITSPATAGPDLLVGTPAIDSLAGLGGDDSLQGLGANDVLAGGGGTDKALYAGTSGQYDWWSLSDGSWRVKDLRAGAPEGTDSLTDVESLQFGDKAVKILGLTTAEKLTDAYSNILRATAAGSELTFLGGLIGAVEGATKTLSAAIGEIVAKADQTTTVATMSYQFFMGFTPSKSGFDYLVSPQGPNPNNINSPYYQHFNIENRYINFALNLGKAGEGAPGFLAEYGSKTLFQATQSAYIEIFGGTVTDAKVSSILDTSVGSMTRAQYFALFSGDGLTGIGTKAAMVGWLLTEAAKADVGMFANASNAFLTDLADGAQTLVDLIGVYGRPEYAFNG